MTHLEKMLKYCRDVTSGKILACDAMRLSCKRTLNDFKKAKEDKDWPFYFDEEAANRIIEFAQRTKQYNDKWKGQYLVLEPWQLHILMSVFGWKKKSDGRRRFRKALCQVGRKNGKSTLLAITLLWDVLTTNGGQAISLATKREQSKIVFNCCREIIRQNPALIKRLQVYNSTSRIVNRELASYIEALAADSDKLDGLNISCAILDEIGSQKNMDLVKVIESSQGSRPEPLLFEIGSATDDMYSAGKQEHDRAIRILKGMEEDDSFFAVIYELEKEDDWRDESLYLKANPNLGVSVNAEFLHNLKVQALSNPSYEGELRTKCLGQYITPISAWILPQIWEVSVKNAQKFQVDKTKPWYALGALDLSKRNDLTAFTTCIYQDGRFFLHHKAYFPMEMLETKLKTDNELWLHWMQKGIVTGTPGKAVDYRVMYQDIMKAKEEWNLECILFDPYNSNGLTSDLSEEMELVEVTQNLKNMSPFIKRLEEEIFKGNVVDANPLMQWEMSHAEVYIDANNNVKLQKPDYQTSGKRIDHCVTSAMAVGYIGSLLDSDEIDLRTAEESAAQLESFLSSLKWG